MCSSFHQIAFKLAQSGSESLPLSCDPLSIMCQVTGLMKTNKYNSMAFRFNKRENLDGFSLNLYTPWEPSKHNYPHCRGMESSRIYTQLYIRLTSVSVTRLAYYIKMHHNILIFFITY